MRSNFNRSKTICKIFLFVNNALLHLAEVLAFWMILDMQISLEKWSSIKDRVIDLHNFSCGSIEMVGGKIKIVVSFRFQSVSN